MTVMVEAEALISVFLLSRSTIACTILFSLIHNAVTSWLLL
jgi:hypothetical protein